LSSQSGRRLPPPFATSAVKEKRKWGNLVLSSTPNSTLLSCSTHPNNNTTTSTTTMNLAFATGHE